MFKWKVGKKEKIKQQQFRDNDEETEKDQILNNLKCKGNDKT